ncbi:hypothetical protein HDU79_001798 [Rhizoclosmatium sp. JEL0117]|nr:hypothetical protein HDU79_001798 [Rhizoclosmatium sp. JEL0117]
MLTLDHATSRAKSEQDRQFQRDRKELLDAEKRAVNAVQSLVKKQRQLEKQMATFSLQDKQRGPTKSTTAADKTSSTKYGFSPPRRTSKSPEKKTHKKRVKKVGATTSSGASTTNKSPPRKLSIQIPRADQCEVIYTEDDNLNQPPPQTIPQRSLSPYEQRYANLVVKNALEEQKFRQNAFLFLQNLDTEDFVTQRFLDSPYSEEEAGLPENWRGTSVEFGKRLKEKIGQLMTLYNDYFNKMEEVGGVGNTE